MIGFIDHGVRSLLVKIAHGFGPPMHLFILFPTYQHVGGNSGVTLTILEHPALWFVIVLQKERRD